MDRIAVNLLGLMLHPVGAIIHCATITESYHDTRMVRRLYHGFAGHKELFSRSEPCGAQYGLIVERGGAARYREGG